MAASSTNGATTADQALEFIVEKAMAEKMVYNEIFDNFHCVHCGSKKPADWIANRKGKKIHCSLTLKPPTIAFLDGTILLSVGPPGPTKAVQRDQPKRADASKAARCCIDWAIQYYGSTATGKINDKTA
jgi:hypothetical protein